MCVGGGGGGGALFYSQCNIPYTLGSNHYLAHSEYTSTVQTMESDYAELTETQRLRYEHSFMSLRLFSLELGIGRNDR